MGAPESVYRLVEKFERHKPGSETEVRVQFVDELFKALGWDMRDKRQVRHEPRVIIQEAGLERSKRPDYSFHIGNPPDFFVETKMPHVNLERNPIPAFQLRRYGWSGNAPVSVLTDFEEFSVYDCRIQPLRSDPANKARLRYFQYGEYIEQWDELEKRFSRDAVAGGALREWVEGERIRGFFSVDQAFLREMENWRETLAQEIALHNRGLSQRDLNLLVQRTIDRIVFLRIAEDRDIEAYGRLRSAAADGKQVYEELKIFFNEADDKYNSGLFHFGAEKRASEPDTLSLNIHIPDQPLRRIINSLYFPYSPYEFSVLSADILGQVYEQFLGKVIEISGGVRVEEKPEVRKAGGVYYTPAYIVDYIVENTVGDLLWGKSPKEAEKLRILDPACGSGSFLTGAYQYLLDWHLKFYSGDPARYRNVIRETRGRYVLTTVEKRRILQNNIYGVDLDQNAVEVSKLSLLLKMLENEDGSDATGLQTVMFSAGERILPDLSGNIKWGNSLIGSDFYSGEQMTFFDDEELLKVKPFDWDSADGFGEVMRSGGFDAVIGNPPYVRMEEFKDIKPYLRSEYTIHADRMDLYGYFIEKEHQLLRDGGLFGMIVSNKFIRARYGKGLRKYIANNANLIEIFDLAGLPVFTGATVRTIIILSAKGTNRGSVRYVPVMSIEDFQTISNSASKLSAVRSHLSYQIEHEQIEGENWSFAKPHVHRLMQRLYETTQSLADYILPLPVCMGVKSGLMDAFVIDDTTRRNIVESNPEAVEIIKPLLNGRDIRKYQINYGNKHLIYAYHGVEIARFPAVEEHLRSFRQRLEKRATKQEWYELQQPQYRFSEYMDNPKIIFPDIGTTTRFALDTTGFYGTNTTYYLPVTDKFLLGILNSRLGQFYFVQVCAGLEGTGDNYLRFFGQYLSGFPVRTIDFDNPADFARHDKMVALVDRMLDWHKQLPGLTGEALRIVNARIERTDREIDELVYALYELSEDEVRVVEGG